jgi:hypothetical protein
LQYGGLAVAIFVEKIICEGRQCRKSARQSPAAPADHQLYSLRPLGFAPAVPSAFAFAGTKNLITARRPEFSPALSATATRLRPHRRSPRRHFL